MISKRKNQIKTTKIQKIFLIFFGLVISLIILELTLRAFGMLFISIYGADNPRDWELFEDHYRILALGESTTGPYLSHPPWPEQLEIILNNNSVKKYKVFNEGIPGTSTGFILSKLEKNLERYNPDMVITMMGINDGVSAIIYDKSFRSKIKLFVRDFRIYKLYKFIKDSMKAKIDNKKSIIKKENYPKTGLDDMSNADKEEVLKIKELTDQVKFSEAEEIFWRVIRLYPDNIQMYRDFVPESIKGSTSKKAINLYKHAIEIDPGYLNHYMSLSGRYFLLGQYDDAEKVLLNALQINSQYVYPYLGQLYSDWGRIDKARLYYSKVLDSEVLKDEIAFDYHISKMISIGIPEYRIQRYINQGYSNLGLINDLNNDNKTKYHYKLLRSVLNDKGIKHIAMQYPRKNINETKSYFNGNEDIIFVSNEENFKKVLKNGKYEDYFIDSFRGTSHATVLGNRLIAENVANVILKELEIET